MNILNFKLAKNSVIMLAFAGLFFLTNCNKTEVPSNDATLKSLAVAMTSGGANLITGFNASTLSYSVTLDPGTTKVFVKATANVAGATVTYSPPPPPANWC